MNNKKHFLKIINYIEHHIEHKIKKQNSNQINTENLSIEKISLDFFKAYLTSKKYKSLKRRKPALASYLLKKHLYNIHPHFLKLKFSYTDLSVILKKSASWFSLRFKEFGIQANSTVPPFPKHKITYKCNLQAFDNWNEEMAYWLGFIWADGYVYQNKDKYCLRVSLKISDIDHLFKLRSFLETTAPIKEDTHKSGEKRYPTATLSIYRKDIAESLIKLGLSVNRSINNISFPKVPDRYLWIFFRGFFDGDGCIQRPQKCNFDLSGWSLSFCGSKNNMIFIKNAIYERTGLKYSICKNGISNFNFTLYRTGPAVFPVLKLLYSYKSKLGLERKMSLSKSLINTYNKAIRSGLKVQYRNDGLRFIQ